MKYDSKTCKLLSAQALTKDVFDFVLEAPELAALANPGQFAQIRLPGHTLRRPISVCGIDKQAGTLRFVFQIRGEGTAELAQFQPGSQIEILAPLGNGFPVDPTRRTLLVGGGIGVPPLLGVAAQLGEKAIAVLGFRNKDAVILEEDFPKVGAKTFIATDDGSYGHHGLVTDLCYGLRPSPHAESGTGFGRGAGRALLHFLGRADGLRDWRLLGLCRGPQGGGRCPVFRPRVQRRPGV